jgi:hypothetical protein
LPAGWAASGLVVAAGVDGQFAEELPGGGVDDADLEVVDEHDEVGSGVGSSDAEVMEAAGHAQGDHAGGSMRSWRTRGWASWSRLVAGRALGRAW